MRILTGFEFPDGIMNEHKKDSSPKGKSLAVLSLAAIGVVYGDIGTSPIYAIRESFHSSYGLAASTSNVLGILSLIFWSLMRRGCLLF